MEKKNQADHGMGIGESREIPPDLILLVRPQFQDLRHVVGGQIVECVVVLDSDQVSRIRYPEIPWHRSERKHHRQVTLHILELGTLMPNPSGGESKSPICTEMEREKE